MKKNVMMRLASFLLVAVLISTSAISGTYAKYVTEGTGTDNARVAKFGVIVTADSEIFDAQYKGQDAAWTAKMTVEADEDVVAPGTTKTMANVGLSGTPEVAVRVSNTAEFEIGDNWKVDASNNNVQSADYVRDTFYCPLIVTVVDAAGTTHGLCGLDYDDADTFEADVESAISTATADYAPGTDLSSAVVKDVQVTWQWAFVGGHTEQTDPYDTQLGDAAAFLNPITVSLSVTTIVTQID